MKDEGSLMKSLSKQARRIKVVDGRFQYRMIAVFLATISLGLLLFLGLTTLYYAIARAYGAAPNPQILLLVLPPLLLNDLAIMVVAIFVGLIVSHRIAGPVYRIAEDIDRVLSGEGGVRVNLRRKDALGDVAQKVNQLIEHVEDARGR
jgi:methyl-accepting chemotaxis protein